MLASVTSWLSGIVDPGARIRPPWPGYSSISFCPMTLCQRMPTSVERCSVTVLLRLMPMRACPCCTVMLETWPTGTPAMLTASPLANPVTSLSWASTVCRLAKSEMLPIFTASPTRSTMQHQGEHART